MLYLLTGLYETPKTQKRNIVVWNFVTQSLTKKKKRAFLLPVFLDIGLSNNSANQDKPRDCGLHPINTSQQAAQPSLSRFAKIYIKTSSPLVLLIFQRAHKEPPVKQ